MNITIYKQKNKKKTKRNYKKTKRNKYKKTKRKYNTKRRKYNTKRRKYYKRGGADRAGEVVESVPTDFPDPKPLDCREIKGKTLYVSKSLNDDDDYDLIYITNFENGKWEEGEELQPEILTSAPTKIGLLLQSLGEYIPLDPDFNVEELMAVKGWGDEEFSDGDYIDEDIKGKVLFEVTPEFIESKKSELFIERLKHCKTCVIGAGDGLESDLRRWGSYDPYFIGFSHMDTLLDDPFGMDWLEDPDIFRRGFEICKSHLPNSKFEHIFIDRGTIQHLDEGGTDAFTPLLEAIISTDISDRLCIDDHYFRKMFEDLVDEDIASTGYYKLPKFPFKGLGDSPALSEEQAWLDNWWNYYGKSQGKSTEELKSEYGELFYKLNENVRLEDIGIKKEVIIPIKRILITTQDLNDYEIAYYIKSLAQKYNINKENDVYHRVSGEEDHISKYEKFNEKEMQMYWDPANNGGVKINTFAELRSDHSAVIKKVGQNLPNPYCIRYWLLMAQDFRYLDKGELILRDFNRTDETISIDNGYGGEVTFHVFTKLT